MEQPDLAKADTEAAIDRQTDPQPAREVLFELRDVGVTLPAGPGGREILTDVQVEVGTGEIVAIVGPSGTGKTTLLRVLSGLLRPTCGTVTLAGRPVTGPSASAVTVFQDYATALLPWRTVAHNVALPLEGKTGKAERRRRVREALEVVGLAERAEEYPWRLSGGMQQRVQIARALVVQPQVLLMDEPFGALDAITKASLHDQLMDVQAQTGQTVMFITHDVDEAVYLSDRVMVIHTPDGPGTPGTIVHTVTTGLPRPRDGIATRDLPGFHAARHELAEVLRDGRVGH
ncbi:MAG: ABC transporter ATP-binding protein [Nocardioides sp.]|uniref:ABC transporter ATP-binding protein n=1 Tax=Nocardioides sp. TaxID=35761 RepID=UPI0039E6AE69